ncbi:specific transcription factor domain protein [Colletotrichum asianum]
MGRPPVTQKVPYGSCEILNFEIDDTPMHSGFEGRARQYSDIESMVRIDIGNNQNIRGVEKDVANEADKIDDAEEADITVATCERTDVDAETSDRMELLRPQSYNKTFRSSGTFGYALTGLYNIAEVLYDCNLPLQVPSPERALVAKQQQHLHRVLSDQQTFYSYHRHFMIVPSFSDSFRGAITVVFARSGGVLLDAYLAALALWDAQHNRMKTLDEVNPREGSNCLKQLQTAATIDAHDAAAVIMLGQVLVVYHIILLGTSAHAILRQSLLLVKDWLPSLLAQPCLYPITITSILVDTVDPHAATIL